MSLTKTPICSFGEKIKDFKLLSTENNKVSLNDVRGQNGTLIMFICNHCPYVKAIIQDLVEDAKYLNELGIKILWAGTNSDETKVFDITEVKDPSKFEVLVKREDITKKRADAGVELESQEVIETISKEYWA